MRRVLKWTAIVLGSLVALIVLIAAAVYITSNQRLNRDYSHVPARPLTVGRPPSVLHGQHLATVIGKCVECHGDGFAGNTFLEDPAVGLFYASNLTTGKGGVLNRYSDAALARAVRQGIRHDGKPLRFMPSEDWKTMGDEDMADLIAYIRSLPPVDKEPRETAPGPVIRALMVKGDVKLAAEAIDHEAPRPLPPPVGPTVEYGHYLADIGGCTSCHTASLKGGHIPGTPPSFPSATDISATGAIKDWTYDQFVTTLRTGVRPNGKPIDPFMPWKFAGQMDSTEMRAVWAFLRSTGSQAK